MVDRGGIMNAQYFFIKFPTWESAMRYYDSHPHTRRAVYEKNGEWIVQDNKQQVMFDNHGVMSVQNRTSTEVMREVNKILNKKTRKKIRKKTSKL